MVNHSTYSPAREPGPRLTSSKTIRGQFRGFQTRRQQATHDFIGEKLHAAIGVVNDKKFSRSQELVADYQGTDGIVAGPSTGIADYVRISFG